MDRPELIEIDGIKYRREPINTGKKYVIVRTYSAGVFAGYLESKENKNLILSHARRLWFPGIRS